MAYGSNMCRDRLLAYLEGATAPEGHLLATGIGAGVGRGACYGAHRGCVDSSPPVEDRWVEVARPLTFRGESPRWGGAVAFLGLDPVDGAAIPARAWLLGVDQLLALVGQEARLPSDPPRSALLGLDVDQHARIGGGWYDTVVRLPDIDGLLAVAVTTSQGLAPAEPAPAYLATMRAGLAQRPAHPESDIA